MPQQRPTTLELLASQDCTRLDADTAVRLSEEIHGLDPVVDARLLAELHAHLRGDLALCKDGEGGGAARVLLEAVAARQSPAGRAVNHLLETENELFTPAMIRALWETRDRARTGGELLAILDEDADAFRFLDEQLVRGGVLTTTTSAEPTYRLTPAGRHAMRPIAQAALAAELGRYPWPEGVPAAGDWAHEQGLELYTFEHHGADGIAVQRCLGDPKLRVGSLSVPYLFGVAGPEPATATHPHCQALAVLFGTEREEKQVVARIDRILEDQDTLTNRTAEANTAWDLTLFTDEDLFEQFGPLMETECEKAKVLCRFVP